LNQSISRIQNERDGLQALQKVTQVLRNAQDYRDYRAIFKLKPEETLGARCDAARQQINAGLQELESATYPFDASGNFRQQLEQVMKDWRQLAAEDTYHSNIDPQFKYYNQFVQKVAALLDTTSQVSGLSQDSSKDIQLILAMNGKQLLETVEELGRVRAYGAYALADGQLGYSLSELMNGIFDRLTIVETSISAAVDVLYSTSDAARAKAGDALKEISGGVVRVRDNLDEHVISPVRMEMPWADFDTLVTGEIRKTFAVSDSLYEVVAEDLNARYELETTQRKVIFAALAIILSIVVYLYMGFFMSVRTAIDRFGTAARRVAGGDLTVRIALDNRDELGALTSEFNNMTERMHQLIQVVSKTASDVDHQAVRVDDTASATSSAVAKQKAETQQISEAMSQMVDTVQEVAESSQRASDAASHADHEADQGRKVVGDTVATINRLAEEISRSVEVINRVSKDSESISQV
ncbi:MAG: methyl-accepting chemotaxis protein, partial [Gammaproteobacteria bacterium]|nr:methyl-accepting chemotaxis protein [Gammaproteobacteria bacterium]